MAFTFFCRESQTLELLVEAVVPSLAGKRYIHVWDTGCANGPEPFTLAMMLRERARPGRPHEAERTGGPGIG